MDPRVASGISRAFVQLSISLVALFFLRLLVGALPVLEDSSPIPGFNVAPVVIAKAVIDTLMLLVVLNLGRQLNGLLRVGFPAVPDLGVIGYLTIIVIVVAIAYKAYQTIASGLLEGDLRLYSWIFLTAIALPLVYLGMLVYRNLDGLTDLVLQRGARTHVESVALACPRCGARIGPEERFCTACGTDLSAAKPQVPVSPSRPAASGSCPQCGGVNAVGANFCRHCGSRLAPVG